MKYPRVLHIVSHTHWDREWYLPFESFRVRLVLLIDNLLEILTRDPNYENFLLDAQAIVLEDYLAIRPEKRVLIQELVQAGRIQIGPWYTASDETLVSGESLVRNLQLGLQACLSFGPVSMVGYLPDQFGHVAQLPQILQGFGIQSVVIGRGINRNRHDNEFLWQSPDGSSVFGLFMNTWYSNARNIPTDPDEAVAYLERAAAQVARTSTTRHLLLMNGVDHMEAQPELGATLQAISQRMPDTVVHSTLEQAIAATRADAQNLKLFQGELREDDGARLDAGTLSARMPLKLANFRSTQLLERIAEPLASLARVMGGPNLTDLVLFAWRSLLQNHPHDSICGCSIDEVALQMQSRFQSVDDLCTTIAERALQALAPALGFTDQPGEILLYNPSVVARQGVEIIAVDIPLAEPTRSPVRVMTNPARTQAPVRVQVTEPDGTPCVAQLLNVEETERLVMAPLHLPRTQPVQRVTAAVKVNVPALGLARYQLRIVPAEGEPPRGLATSNRRLENEHLCVEIAADNTMWLTHKASGRRLGPMHVIEDGGDIGDTYHYIAPRLDDVIHVTQATRVSLVEDGPLTSALRLRYEITVPAGVTPDRHARSSATTTLTIETTVRLKQGAHVVTFDTVVDNTACDHRLRVVFPSGVATDEFTAGSQFCAVTRPVELPADWRKPAAERPQWGWSDVSNQLFGVAVLSRGLTEVEPIVGDGETQLAITLLRSVGAVSRATATPLVLDAPDAQCLGRHRFTYAVYPHSDDWRSGQVWPAWETHAAELLCAQPRPADEATGRNSQLVGEARRLAPVTVLEGSQFILSALKSPTPVRDSGNSPFNIVVRGFSLSPLDQQVTLRFLGPVKKAYRLTLAEVAEEELAIDGDTVSFTVTPGSIATIGVHVSPA